MKQRTRRRHLTVLMAATVQRNKVERLVREFGSAFSASWCQYVDTQRAFMEAMKQTVLRSIVRELVRPIVAQLVATLPAGGFFTENTQ